MLSLSYCEFARRQGVSPVRATLLLRADHGHGLAQPDLRQIQRMDRDAQRLPAQADPHIRRRQRVRPLRAVVVVAAAVLQKLGLSPEKIRLEVEKP